MTLAELVREIAAQLGNTWRPGYTSNGTVSVPVIFGPEMWLIFGPSPDGPLLRITLATPEGDPLVVDVAGSLGIGETTIQIRERLLAPYYDQRWLNRRYGGLIKWHKDWCARFTTWAEAQKLRVRFSADYHRGVLISLCAEFTGRDSQPWGAITVYPDGEFPARVEYFTDDATLRARIAVWVEDDPTAEPVPELPPAPVRRRLGWLRRSSERTPVG
jgi:hypothetical protein